MANSDRGFIIFVCVMMVLVTLMGFTAGTRFPGPIRIREPQVYENFIQTLDSLEGIKSYTISRNRERQTWNVSVYTENLSYNFSQVRDILDLEKQIEDLKRFLEL